MSGIVYPPLLIASGLLLWLMVYESGVHATIAGVIVGLAMPARPSQTELEAQEIVDLLEDRSELNADEVRASAIAIKGSVSACDRLIDVLHPWTSLVIVPLFALANAGIELSASALSERSAVFSGVAVGLFVGKLTGIVAFSWLAVRLGIGCLPAGARWGPRRGRRRTRRNRIHGLTFITDLAFDSEHCSTPHTGARIGVVDRSVNASSCAGSR